MRHWGAGFEKSVESRHSNLYMKMLRRRNFLVIISDKDTASCLCCDLYEVYTFLEESITLSLFSISGRCIIVYNAGEVLTERCEQG